MSRATGSRWSDATYKIIVCIGCRKNTLRTGRNQTRCHRCAVSWSKERGRKKSYEIAVRSGRIKQPGVGVGNGQGFGPNHHSWKTGSGGYRRWTKSVCEKCGSQNFLCAHHKDRDRSNNVPENIETLCKSCHQKEHEVHLNFTKNKGAK